MPVNKASIDWTKVKNKPSTLSGFGITDGFGSGQTWQSVTGSRTLGTTYTNTTGKPIAVWVRSVTTTAAIGASLTVNGIEIFNMVYPTGSTSGFAFCAGIVPPGATYVVAIGTTLGNWTELR